MIYLKYQIKLLEQTRLVLLSKDYSGSIKVTTGNNVTKTINAAQSFIVDVLH